MKRGTYPPGFIKAAETKSDPQLASLFQVTPTTIRNWKKRLGIAVRPRCAVIYDQIDALLKEEASPAEISRKTGYSLSAIKHRRIKLYGPKYKKAPRPKRVEGEPLPVLAIYLPHEERFRLACEDKAAFMGMSLDKFMSTWLPTPTGQDWKFYLGF